MRVAVVYADISCCLQSQDPQNSEVLKVNLVGEQSVQSMLGIQTGGADALTALSLLCGGDYAIKGAENVGSKQAVRMLQHLLEGHQVSAVRKTSRMFHVLHVLGQYSPARL